LQIKCIKEARNSQTKYQDLDGNEINVNDGNTWVNICPISADIEIEGSNTNSSNTNTNVN
jgi:hypothetical protein